MSKGPAGHGPCAVCAVRPWLWAEISLGRGWGSSWPLEAPCALGCLCSSCGAAAGQGNARQWNSDRVCACPRCVPSRPLLVRDRRAEIGILFQSCPRSCRHKLGRTSVGSATLRDTGGSTPAALPGALQWCPGHGAAMKPEEALNGSTAWFLLGGGLMLPGEGVEF